MKPCACRRISTVSLTQAHRPISKSTWKPAATARSYFARWNPCKAPCPGRRFIIAQARSCARGSPRRSNSETGKPSAFGTAFLRGRQFWSGAASGVAATALAAALAFVVLLPPPSTPLVNDVMSAHLRSLMANHLIDVVSSDQHTVKPWFAGHADVSPPTADFPKEDYRLVGGRVDYVDGHRAAVLVYRHGAHIINVFSWAQSGETLPNIVTRNGYHAVFWQGGDLVFCAVSDTALDELLGLVRLIKEISIPDSRE